MAAPRGSESGSGSGSSEDSDAEELRRCREAAVPAPGWGARPARGQGAAVEDAPAARSRRQGAAQQAAQDGLALQTTPGFRLHVARRLGALLDSCISISEAGPRPSRGPPQPDPGEDDGFRLFSTSVPGSPPPAGPPAPRRKRPASSSSSSESDGEQRRRCREAAVSGADLLRGGAPPAERGEAPPAPKKKKKKRRKPREEEGQAPALPVRKGRAAGAAPVISMTSKGETHPEGDLRNGHKTLNWREKQQVHARDQTGRLGSP